MATGMAALELAPWELLTTLRASPLGAAAAALVFMTALLTVGMPNYGQWLWATMGVWLEGGKPLPPGSMGMPYLGETEEYTRIHSDWKNPDAWYDARRKKFGNVFKTHILGSPTVVVLGAEGNKFVLQNGKKFFANNWPIGVRTVLGDNAIAVTSGEQHKKLRRAAAQFIGLEALRRHVSRLEASCVKHLDRYWEGKDEVKVYESSSTLAFNAASDLFMNLDSEVDRKRFLELYDIMTPGMFTQPIDLPWTAFGRAKRARKEAMEIVGNEIRRRRRALVEKTTELSATNLGASKDIMDFLLVWDGQDAGYAYAPASDAEISDNMIQLLQAGHDTTASALTTLIQHLISNPDVHEKLREECRRMSDSKAPGESLTMADVKSMNYMRNVILEGLRTTPALPGAFKKATANVSYQGYTIPKGWTVHYSPRQTLIDGNYYENPREFNPDRFKEARHDPYSFIPFGQGWRMCPGSDLARLEMHLFLYHLLLRYDLELVNPDEPYKMYFFPTPRDGLPVRVRPIGA